MKRIVAFYKNGDRYLKEMGSGKSSLYYIVCGNVLFCPRRLLVFERGTKIQSDFCPTLMLFKLTQYLIPSQNNP